VTTLNYDVRQTTLDVGGCEYCVHFSDEGGVMKVYEVRESLNNHLVTHEDPMYDVVVAGAWTQLYAG
jgi:hypothetical protein